MSDSHFPRIFNRRYPTCEGIRDFAIIRVRGQSRSKRSGRRAPRLSLKRLRMSFSDEDSVSRSDNDEMSSSEDLSDIDENNIDSSIRSPRGSDISEHERVETAIVSAGEPNTSGSKDVKNLTRLAKLSVIQESEGEDSLQIQALEGANASESVNTKVPISETEELNKFPYVENDSPQSLREKAYVGFSKTYSLAESPEAVEEKVAGNFICFKKYMTSSPEGPMILNEPRPENSLLLEEGSPRTPEVLKIPLNSNSESPSHREKVLISKRLDEPVSPIPGSSSAIPRKLKLSLYNGAIKIFHKGHPRNLQSRTFTIFKDEKVEDPVDDPSEPTLDDSEI